MDGATGAWFDREIAGCSFADERLNKRLRNLLERMGDAMGASIPLACQDWAKMRSRSSARSVGSVYQRAGSVPARARSGWKV